ncbi:isopentenyl-diphosphate Delta-isomerase [Candidatus Woesebacteria bacterium]|nr:isopentenyl-diphosphate Delta-isomerase [Candidatus Woesebacteria bacterium]
MLNTKLSNQNKIMNSGNETIMLVDSSDAVIGEIGKIEAHQKLGRLHRAFTIFLQNQKGEWLITKRSEQKPLWPLWWDAACSSHPWFPNETIEQAALRRMPFELGLQIEQVHNLRVAGAYEYHAVYSPKWSENEINHIVVANFDGELSVNSNEVTDFKWLTPEQIDERLTKPNLFVPWFAQAWHEVTLFEILATNTAVVREHKYLS